LSSTVRIARSLARRPGERALDVDDRFLGEDQWVPQLVGVVDKELGRERRLRLSLNGGIRLRRTTTFTNSDPGPAMAPVTGRSIEVQGHTDERGDDDYNLDLSRRRAAAVVDYLVAHGVDPGRLTSRGYGETQPIDRRHTEAAWALNRRVSFVLKKQKHD
jgi:hypothetical protein